MGDVPGPSTAPSFQPNKATENFARLCQLVMTICSDLFRDILSHYIKPADLRSKLDNNGKKLKRIMNDQQKEQIYPSSGTTTLTAKDLDISILYILLRNISKIPRHHNDWGNPPLDSDTSLAACIERIRIQRNLISGHSNIGQIEDAAFQDHWDKLKNNILEIEKQLTGGDMYERGVDELLSCDLNPTRSETYVKEFKNIQGKLLNKSERMDSFASALETANCELDVKRRRLDDVEHHLSAIEQISDLDSRLSTTIQNTFKDLETTLLKTMQDGFAALKEKQKALSRASNKTGPSAVWRSDITVAGYQKFDDMLFVTPTVFWMRIEQELFKVDSSGTILVNNESLKIDTEFTLTEGWSYYTVTQRGDLLFLGDKYVKKFASEGTLTTIITAEPEESFTSIHSCSNGDILTAVRHENYTKVLRYNKEGIIDQEIQKDDQEIDIYRYSISRITVNKINQDILSIMRSKLVGVEKTGRYKFSYNGQTSEKHFNPRGISTDSRGQILVSSGGGWQANQASIHALDQEGHFIRFLLTEKKNNIKAVLSICLNENELYLLNEKSNKISVYDYQSE